MKFKKKLTERLPRKIKKQIPKGMYCYTATSETKHFEDGSYGYTIKRCSFFTYVKIKDKPEIEEWEKEFLEEDIPWCKLVKCEPLDQCKSCGIKYVF
jgi:hypothetical protein